MRSIEENTEVVNTEDEFDEDEIDRRFAEAAHDYIACDEAEPGEKKKANQATRLVELASQAEFWHTPDGDAYASINIDGHCENCPIKSKSFRRWLQWLYHIQTSGSAVNAQAVQDAIGVLEGKAIFDGLEHKVFVRVAECGGRIYIDLADRNWQALEIDSHDWRIIQNPPVMFRRSKAMLPLPTPIKGGMIEQLRPFVNVSDDDYPLLLGCLVASLWPHGPYPVLCFSSEQGSGKSTTVRVCRALIDPNSAPLRCEPRDARDLMIAANNGWVIALDNLSFLPAWLSDALCRLSTGGGFSTRTLYENDEETIFNAMRPAILNGVEDIASRGDLIDRAIILNPPAIPEHQRRDEAEFWARFEAVRPEIFGALLDALSAAIRCLPTVKLPGLPRMADFAKLATAAESGLGLPSGAFMSAYAGNIQDANSLALDACPVARYLVEVAGVGAIVQDGLRQTAWQGTAAELLDELNNRADENSRKQRAWPKTARAVSGIVSRLAPNLRRIGIAVDHWREPDKKRRRMIRIEEIGKEPSEPSEIAENPENGRTQADDAGRSPDDWRTQN
jgi:hypothetical protein